MFDAVRRVHVLFDRLLGVAAGLGIQAAIQASPALHGSSVTVLGCPAEEGEGGKIKMIEQGTNALPLE